MFTSLTPNISKVSINTVLIVAFAFILNLTFLQFANAQTKGLIVKPATTTGAAILDPDGDGYVSKKTNSVQLGFQANDYNSNTTLSESEIPYRPLPLPETEPMNDLARGPGGGFSDFADMNGTVYPVASYLSPAGNLMFRFRLGGIAPNSKGYSILVDADNKFGFSGANADPQASVDNPGFEFEILLATNFAVRVYNVNNSTGTATALTTDTDFPYAQHAQKAIAYTTNSGNADYFYDFYLPFPTLQTKLAAAGITIDQTTGLRMVANTIMAPQSAIKGPISDIGGLNDSNYSNPAAAWSKIVAGFVPTSASGTTSSPFPAVRSNAPVITSTLLAGTGTISGTSSEANGTTITVYKNGVALGTTTVSGGTWTYPSTGTIALTLNDRFTATATASGKSESDLSNEVIVKSACTYSTTPTLGACAGVKGLDGTVTGATSGTTINVYNINNPGVVFASVLTGANGQAANGFLYKNNGNYSNCNSGANDMPAGSYFVTSVQGSNCESTRSAVQCFGNITTAAHTVDQTTITQKTTQLTGTITSGTGTKISVYIGGIYAAQTTVASGTTWSISGLVFQTGQAVDIYAVTGTSCAYTISMSVVDPTATPVVNSPINANATSISGTSSEAAGTVITIYKGGVSMGTATVTSTGTWTLTGVSGLVAGNTITATALASYKTVSATSNTVTVVAAPAATPAVPAVTGSYTEGGTSVSGTGPASTTINVYIDGYLLGTVTSAANGTWTLTGLSAANYDLYAGGVLTATSGTIGSNESAKSAGVTVACLPPALKTVTGYTTPVCQGSTNSFTIAGSENGIIYTLKNGSTERSSSVLGTGGTITLTSYALNTTPSETFTVDALKLSGGSCSPTSTSAMVITVNAKPTASLTVSAPSTVASGATANVTVQSSQVNYLYQLREGTTNIGSTVTGTGGTITLPTNAINASRTFNVLATDVTKSTNCTQQLTQTVTIGISGNQPLPVELVNFTAEARTNGAQLQWFTATEKNSDYFQVERSFNGRDFEAIGKVKSIGNSSSLQSYQYFDVVNATGKIYYRLKQVDFDGTSEYSKIVVVNKNEEAQNNFVLYPNPTTAETTLLMNIVAGEEITVAVRNAVGQEIYSRTYTVAAGETKLTIDSKSLPNGVYFVTISGKAGVQNLKLQKN